MTCGVIDVGSNSIRLSVYTYEEGLLRELLNKKEMAGLAGYVEEGVLLSAGVQRACEILSGFRDLLALLQVQDCRAFATQSLRGIKNAGEAVATILSQTGISVEIISGEEEALLDFIGVRRSMNLESGVLVDIGGGSTELVVFQKGRVQKLVSMPIGSLSLYKKHVSGLFPTKEEVRPLRREVQAMLQELNWREKGTVPTLCGVGGTTRAARKLSCELLGSSPSQQSIPAEHARLLLKQLCGSVEECRAVLRVVPERTFTILPGLCLLSETVKYFDAKTLLVSKSGVRDGYFYHKVLAGQA